MQGPSTNQTSSDESYTISPSNTTTANASYTQLYINSFYQNSNYTTPLVRAFDSFTSSDGGNTWTAPTSGSPTLPPSSYTSVPGGDVPLFKSGSTSTYATDVKDVVGSTTRNASWELDGYSKLHERLALECSFRPEQLYVPHPLRVIRRGQHTTARPSSSGPPTRIPLSSSNSTQFNQFFADFGYAASDYATNTPLQGVYKANTTSGSQNWPWPNDGGTSLSTYLTTKVSIPASQGSRKLLTSDSYYQKIMRLYWWNYVIDNLGTTPCDWRMRFFGTTNNTVLFNSSGTLNPPGSSSYTINYGEITRWIAQSPNPFPTQLHAGRITYYSSIPTPITGTWPNYGSTDQRFWVEFIDYVLGFRQTSAGVYTDISAMAGYGSDFTWGTTSISSQPSQTQYMSYSNNPLRPLMHTGSAPWPWSITCKITTWTQTFPTTFSCSRPMATSAELLGQRGLHRRNQHHADGPPQRLGDPGSLQLAAIFRFRLHRQIQLCALPAGNKLPLRHGRSRFPVLHDQC